MTLELTLGRLDAVADRRHAAGRTPRRPTPSTELRLRALHVAPYAARAHRLAGDLWEILVLPL